jgi:hypothetical protein
MFKKLLFTGIAVFIGIAAFAQTGVAISATPTTPNAAAMLDVISTNKGILIPRLSATQRNAIVGAPNGLTVYDSSINKYMYYNQPEAAWKLLGSDTLEMPFNKTFNFNTSAGSGYVPQSAIFSITNNGSNGAAFFRNKQTGSTRGHAAYAEYDGNHIMTGYNSAMAVYGMNGKYTTGLSAYSDSTAAIDAYNLYRGTAIIAQNSVNFGGGPFAGIAAAVFNSNKTLEGYACGIYQDYIEASPLVFNYANAAIVGYSEAGAGGKFFGTDTAIHAIGNTYLMGNLRIANGTEGGGKILRSDASGNAIWSANNRIDAITIPAVSFHALNGNGNTAEYTIDAGSISPYNDITVTNYTFNLPLVAAVQLPNFATITGFTLYAFDNNNTVGLKADLVTTPNAGTGNTILFSATTGAGYASTNFYETFPAGGSPATVSNYTNTYLLKIYPVDGLNNLVNWSAGFYIKGVSILFTYAPLD